MDLSSEFLGVKFRNPFVLASGIPGTGNDKLNVFEGAGAGGITTKSISPEERKGNPMPRIYKFEHGFINSVGLPCPPLEKSIPEIAQLKKNSGIPIIASIVAEDIEGFALMAEKVSEAKPDIIELDMSCPTVIKELGLPFAMVLGQAGDLVREAKKRTSIPITAKLSPNVSNIAEIAMDVQKAGADAITAVNSVGPGMLINTKTGKPVLGNKFGGVSGPAIKPIAIKCVYEIFESVKIPIIGTGGIANGKDAVEMLMAGASLIGIGSAVWLRGNEVFKELEKETLKEMGDLGIKSIEEIIGYSHKQ